MKHSVGVLKWAAAIVGGWLGVHIVLAVLVALVAQSIPTGAKASLSLMHYETVMAGALLSYGDNLGPDLREGKAIGDKQLASKGGTA